MTEFRPPRLHPLYAEKREQFIEGAIGLTEFIEAVIASVEEVSCCSGRIRELSDKRVVMYNYAGRSSNIIMNYDLEESIVTITQMGECLDTRCLDFYERSGLISNLCDVWEKAHA